MVVTGCNFPSCGVPRKPTRWAPSATDTLQEIHEKEVLLSTKTYPRFLSGCSACNHAGSEARSWNQRAKSLLAPSRLQLESKRDFEARELKRRSGSALGAGSTRG